MAIEIRITGIEAVNARLAVLAEQHRDAAVAALREEAETIMTTSKRLVPVDTGVLRESGFVDAVDEGVRLAYGGAASGYAIYVHENLEARHPVGQAKYLEQPVLEALPGLAGRVAAVIRSILRT